MDYVFYNNNYYGFSINHFPGKLVRLDFGSSLLNVPTAVDFGNFGGIIPSGYGAEGIQIVQNEGKWYAIIVGGYTPSGSTPRILKVEFGANLLNGAPTATDWGNIGTMSQPLDLHVFQENNQWYGITINAENNTVTRFSFSNSFDNTPTGVNLGSFGLLSYPTGLFAINDNGEWRVFVTNNGNNSRLVRLDFGNSLLNNPTAVDLGSVGGTNGMRDITILKYCEQTVGYAVNAITNSLYKLEFATLTSIPVVSNLGNTGNLRTPHSISKLFRDNADIYAFITNVGNNTITRLKFSGCNNASFPNSSLQNPPPFAYDATGTYNINLTIDDGLATQGSICKQVVVVDCRQTVDSVIVNEYTEVISLETCNNKLLVGDASEFNIGDTVLLIQMQGAIIDSSNTTAYGTVTDFRSAGNYEYNYVKSKTGNELELLNIITKTFDVAGGKVQLVRVPYFQGLTTTSVLTCLPWDGRKGGILVFNVNGGLNLGANIDVTARGFRGGFALNNAQFNCNFTGFFDLQNTGINAARKGESIFNTSRLMAGRGKSANGGGGGNATNSGGAGGGNGGSGGNGGNQFQGCGNNNFINGGIGGVALPYSNAANRIFMGGGGGAGHMNDVPALGAGGNGGGIVIINTTTLESNGFSINSNGGTPVHLSGSNDDGHSGGGAGGTVLLRYTTAIGNISSLVIGGKGDYATPPMLDAHGPGGGGGGGVLWVSQPALPTNLVLGNSGGVNGTNTNIANNPWGAMPGQDGTVLTGLVLPVSTVPFKINIDSVRINKSRLSCGSFSFEGLGYVNTFPVSSWQWYFGDGGTASTQNTSHTYTVDGNYTVKLVVTDINGCKDSITTDVTATVINIDFTYKQDVCDPLTIQLVPAGSPTTNPFWDFGDGNTLTGVLGTTHTYNTTGVYTVRYSVTNGSCSDTLEKLITVDIQADDIILTPDTTICIGALTQLRTVPSLSFCWTPTTFLNDPLLPNPVSSTQQNIRYYFTAEITGNNLIVNGDFSQGNSGFSSAYVYSPASGFPEGTYNVGNNVTAWHGGLPACSDHTTGNGNMMMINGSAVSGTSLWSQQVTVQPNTNYAFSTWLQSLESSNPSKLQFSINGKPVGTDFDALQTNCTWKEFYTTWNSGQNTTATISIINKNVGTAGNDFALDDISFAPVFIKRDSVNIIVETPSVTTNADTTVCVSSPVQLVAAGAATYSWSPAAGLTDGTISNPVSNPLVSTEYIVTGTTVNGCIDRDTVNVNVFTIPANTMITNDTSICRNSSLQLQAAGGVVYNWTPASTLNNGGIFNPIASPVNDTRYLVSITDANNCIYEDSVLIQIRPDAIFTISGPSNLCSEDTIQLLATGGDTYTWQPAIGLNDPTLANPMANPLSSTSYSVTVSESVCNQSATLTTQVTVIPLPVVTASRSNDIDCSNENSRLTATGGNLYSWSPASSLSNPVIYNPIATPAGSTMYVVKGTDAQGCVNYDSVLVKVELVNKGGYLMPSAFTPNADGLNDCYGVKSWGAIENLEFSIYNRWGERVFFTNNPSQCWDGRYKGQMQDTGVFVYMVKANTLCEPSVFRKGTFVLVR